MKNNVITTNVTAWIETKLSICMRNLFKTLLLSYFQYHLIKLRNDLQKNMAIRKNSWNFVDQEKLKDFEKKWL